MNKIESEPRPKAVTELIDSVHATMGGVLFSSGIALFFPSIALWILPLSILFGLKASFLSCGVGTFRGFFFGLLPLATFGGVLLIKYRAPAEEHLWLIRAVNLSLLLIVVPVGTMLSTYFENWKKLTPPLTHQVGNLLAQVFAIAFSLFFLASLVVALFWFAPWKTFHPSLLSAKRQLSEADQRWDQLQASQAVNLYKQFLSTDESLLKQNFSKDLDRVLRRVIEFEADYGDRWEAIDQIEKAIRLGREPYLDSSESRELWENVKSHQVGR